ncbi:MAG: alkaline phosphatase family protein [Nocardioides sp.]
MHTPRHYFPEEHGHVGEHGSLDLIQSRAPFILSGVGVKQSGFVDAYARLVDVGPTLASLAGVPDGDLVDKDGAALDGRVVTEHLTGEKPRYVIGMLWDGAHCGELLAMAERGEAPGVARLIANGLALRGGGISEFPSITLTNHTAILTGVGPGRHGVMGNVYFDRISGERVVPNDQSTWHRSGEWLHDGARTIFEMVADTLPEGGLRTASVDEAIDRGSDYSTMALIRGSGESGADALDDALPDPHTSPYLRNPAFLEDDYFRWGVRVDDLGLQQMLDLFATPESAPKLTWWANVVTDCGHHGAGPRSEMALDAFRQSDARLVSFLEHLDALGITDQVTFLLTADHGFEGSREDVRGSWKPALDSVGVPYRDEGPGLVYLVG